MVSVIQYLYEEDTKESKWAKIKKHLKKHRGKYIGALGAVGTLGAGIKGMGYGFDQGVHAGASFANPVYGLAHKAAKAAMD